jgi:hypothetical protein
MNKPTLNLMLPGLWMLLRTVQQQIEIRLPSLERLLARCDYSIDSDAETEHAVLAKLGLAENGPAPIAALERLANPDRVAGGWWLRADPVSLVADRQYIIMQHPGGIDLDADEARQLIDLINLHFNDDGWQLEMAAPDRWYLGLRTPLEFTTIPAWRVFGKDIHPYLPVGGDGLKWHAWLNELQMLLHSAATNERRIAAGRSPVNGVWVSGGGSVNFGRPGRSIGLWGDTPFLQGLSRHIGLPCPDLPDDWQTIISSARDDNEAIVWLDQARQALTTGNVERGAATLEQMEQDVFKPLLPLLNKRHLARISLIDTPGHAVQVSASGLRRWWRKRRPVPDLDG